MGVCFCLFKTDDVQHIPRISFSKAWDIRTLSLSRTRDLTTREKNCSSQHYVFHTLFLIFGL
jgi:hypothetical protein